MNEGIYQKLEGFLITKYGCSANEIKSDSHLMEDLALDSLDMLELCMDMETEFNLTLDTDEFVAVSTVGKIVEYVEGKIEDRRPLGNTYNTSIGHRD